MGNISPIQPAKLFIGIIASNKDIILKMEPLLFARWGKIDTRSAAVDFKFTTYYEKEMGRNLLRQWISFDKLIDPGQLAQIKIETNEIESKFVIDKSRQINLDPGYMALSKIVLASTKDFSHRIYLSNGIHAEITMIFKDKQFTVLPWTYPDYSSEFAKNYFYRLRDTYQNQLKNQQ
jgi:hypothetical protein